MENSARGQIQQEANSSIQNENTEILVESRTSSGNENQNEQLVIDIETMSKTSEFLESDECRIYKVPYHLRKWNEEAYTPQVISIGPYHHNNKKFQTMEKHKVRYFESFMERAGINSENLVATITEMEDIIRHCYVDTVQLGRDDFVKMIMLDATFILELFLKDELVKSTKDDPMVVEAWLYDKVKLDLLLLENQLPFFVIKKIYHLAFPSYSNSKSPYLIQLTFDFFKYLNIRNRTPEGKIKHFTDLLRFFALCPQDKLPQRNSKTVFPKYSATQLRDAGLKFEVLPNKYVPDLSFKKQVLGFPLLEFHDHTEAYVRNIMALEECCHKMDRYITDFYLILERLINTDKDVDFLSDKGIIVNILGDNNAITSMINNLKRGIPRNDMNSNYCQLCEDLNAFYEQPWNKWRALCFSTPLRTASSNVAITALVLTLIQTICSIIQMVPIG